MFDNIKDIGNSFQMHEIWDIPTGGKCMIDFYGPAHFDKPFTSFIYIHGGGLYAGEKGGLGPWCHELIRKGYGFFSIDYPLYPNTKFPEYLVESARLIKFIFDHCKEYGASGEIYLIGESAGGWIQLMLATNKKYFQDIGFDDSRIKGFISLSGSATDEVGILKYELGVDPDYTRVSEYAPLYYVTKGLKTSPLLLISHTEDQFLNRCLNNDLFYNQVKKFTDIDITLIKLPGIHCQSMNLNSDGSCNFNNILFDWLKNH